MEPTALEKPKALQTSWQSSVIQTSLPFIIGCFSGMVATAIIQPIDTIKVRLQLMQKRDARPSPLMVIRQLMAQGKLGNLYDGLSAALLRQVVYGTARLGLFSTFEQKLEKQAREKGRRVTFGERTLAGVSAGAIAAFIGNPTEVALIRMQADAAAPPEHQVRYKSAVDALRRTTNEEGIKALWKGTSPTVVRAMSTNFGQLTFFSETKNQLRLYGNVSSVTGTAIAAAVGGFAGALISQPFDFVKTRMQSRARGDIPGRPTGYRGTIDCFVSVARTEGLTRFYRDFWPYFWRVLPQS
jgi:solute carrier family 25 oxoglutarate transporter 11